MENLEKLKNLEVLYVEDDVEMNEVTTDLFKKLFKDVKSAYNHKEAMQIFITNPNIDLLISDISLPEKDGIELATDLKEKKKNLKILFITAHNESSYLSRAIELGADGFLFKPFTLNEFLKTTEKIAQTINLEKENEEFKQNLINLVKEKTEEILHDPLTKLPNSAKFNMDIEQKKDIFAILVDINNFKKINSAFGFDMGDEVLIKTAQILQKYSDNVYRLSGDTFILLFDNATKTFESLHIELKKMKIHYKTFPVFITFSIVAFFTNSKNIKNDLTKAIDYIKEHNIKNKSLFLDEEKLEKTSQKSKKISIILNKIQEQKIVPFFQPIVNTSTLKTEKYEVLARIVDDGKIWTPFEFIDHIQKIGLIEEVTKQIITKSFPYAKEHKLSINITDYDLKNKNFLSFVVEECKKHRINPSQITFEILENISISEEDIIIENIQQLKQENFLIAIDDFGAGFSNFERLMQIKPDFLKIDGKFIKNIDTDKNSEKITKAIISLAKEINTEVVAEFVENEKILEKIQNLEIKFAQGYYFSKPIKEPK
jgi:diguanylate cyclase (GGDEF)-like protein